MMTTLKRINNLAAIGLILISFFTSLSAQEPEPPADQEEEVVLPEPAVPPFPSDNGFQHLLNLKHIRSTASFMHVSAYSANFGYLTGYNTNIASGHMYIGQKYTGSSALTPFIPSKATITANTVNGVKGQRSYYAQRGTDLEIKAGDRTGGAASNVASTSPYGVGGGNLIFKCSSGLTHNGGIYFKNTDNKSVMGLGHSSVSIGSYKHPVTLWIVGKIKIISSGADFVFGKDYRLPTLGEVENFIQTNQHLPGLTPAAKMQEEGMDLSETTTKLLQKIEELTLYTIEQEKAIEKLKQEVSKLKEQK